MFWRVIAGFGGLTFLAGGIDVASRADCATVTFGGTRRNSSYTCFPDGQGEVSAGLAAAGMISLAGVMLAFAFWPLLRRLRDLPLGSSRRQKPATPFRPSPHRGLSDSRVSVNVADNMVVRDKLTPNYKLPIDKFEVNPTIKRLSDLDAAKILMSHTSTGSWRADPTGRYERRYWDGRQCISELVK